MHEIYVVFGPKHSQVLTRSSYSSQLFCRFKYVPTSGIWDTEIIKNKVSSGRQNDVETRNIFSAIINTINSESGD